VDAGACENSNEPSGSFKERKFLDCVSDNQLIKKDPAP
jgi:hypothetical protein